MLYRRGRMRIKETGQWPRLREAKAIISETGLVKQDSADLVRPSGKVVSGPQGGHSRLTPDDDFARRREGQGAKSSTETHLSDCRHDCN